MDMACGRRRAGTRVVATSTPSAGFTSHWHATPTAMFCTEVDVSDRIRCKDDLYLPIPARSGMQHSNRGAAAHLRLTSDLLELLYLRIDAHAEHQEAKRCRRCNQAISMWGTKHACAAF